MLEGIQIRKRYVLHSLETVPGARRVFLKLERLEPAALAERVFESDQLELKSPVSREEEPGVSGRFEKILLFILQTDSARPRSSHTPHN